MKIRRLKKVMHKVIEKRPVNEREFKELRRCFEKINSIAAKIRNIAQNCPKDDER